MTERDLLDWRGIGTGYLLMLCYGAAFAMIALAPPGLDRWEQREAFVLGLMLLYGGWALVKRPARRVVEWWAEGRRTRHEGLKNAAVVVMCLLSAVLCIVAFPLASRFSW
ncbi:hypothetical protein SAMN02745194_01407 [Roseomonas rosea]|uniref:Uncharacterized protein n=1 Tax=Muricoccus roseus TaxID=198092 RepID=A0A1M6F5N1_9PROT|nr:hypothetical protein [Roseomonas rosea]SHI93028.1 hypothetical protein SAMN02745194_01407 [Roseomonas rosea]